MAYKLNPFTGKFDYYEKPVIISDGRVSNLSLVYYEQFVGDGADTTFNITGSLGNAIYQTGTWKLNKVATTLPLDITSLEDGALFDSANIFTRNRIEVQSISGTTGEIILSAPPLNLTGFKIWYWYTLEPKDVLSFYYRPEYVSKMEADMASAISAIAANVNVNITNFDTILSSTDDTVQKALDTLDKHTHPETPIYNYMPGGWS